MRRRDFVSLVGGSAIIWPLAARAQQGERMRRVGVLVNVAEDDLEAQAENLAFLQGLQQLGWTDGRNIRIDTRWTAGDPARVATTIRNVKRRVSTTPMSASMSFAGCW